MKRNLAANDSCEEGKRSPDNTGINLGREFRERFLRSKAAGSGLILEVFSSIVLLCIRSIMIIIMIIIAVKPSFNVTNKIYRSLNIISFTKHDDKLLSKLLYFG